MIQVLALIAVLALRVQDPRAVPTPAQVEQEVLENVKHQPLADGTVEDLALPEDFLRRIADRIVRGSFEERYRIVVKDPPAVDPAKEVSTGSSSRNSIVLSVVALVLASVGWILLTRRRDRAAA